VKLPPGQGVLASQHLLRAIDEGVVSAGEWSTARTKQNVQPASVDLRLGPMAYRIQCSFLPGPHPVERKVKEVLIDTVDLSAGAVLDTLRPYLIPLKEQLALPTGMRARANPKSSTGRVDVFTRVITDHSSRFDDVEAGYEGKLYLEVVPLSFPIRVREDLCLNQLRLMVGRASLADEEIRAAHERSPLLYTRRGEVVGADQLPLADGLFLSLDLRGDARRRVGYRARDTRPLLDMTEPSLDPEAYWVPEFSQGDHIVLKEEGFYLLMSDEAVSIPPWLAAEMTAYDPTNGELRTHYAGFFDPGFGYDPTGRHPGSRAALEVRAHDVAFMIEHRQRVCRLTFERMLEPPDTLYGDAGRSSYQHQLDPLAKQFPAGEPAAGPGRPGAEAEGGPRAGARGGAGEGGRAGAGRRGTGAPDASQPELPIDAG
jgi:dCTP deaminase